MCRAHDTVYRICAPLRRQSLGNNRRQVHRAQGLSGDGLCPDQSDQTERGFAPGKISLPEVRDRTFGHGHDLRLLGRPPLAQHRHPLAEYLFQLGQQLVGGGDFEFVAQVEHGFAALGNFQAQARVARAGELAQ